MEVCMITREQEQVLREVEALVRQADLMVVQAGLPAVVSGAHELGWGLSTARAGLEILLSNRSKR